MIQNIEFVFCWHSSSWSFFFLYSCKYYSYLCLAVLAYCNSFLVVSRECCDNFFKRSWSFIKWRDWIDLSSLLYVRRLLFRLDPLSREACPWLITNNTCKTMHSSLCLEKPVNSSKKKSSNLCRLRINASIFSSSLLNQVWTNDVNCYKALSLVVAGITFKNVNRFSSSFIDSTALDSNCLGSRHYLACFTIMDPNGLLSNNFSAVVSRNFRHCFLHSETSASVKRFFLNIPVMISSVGNPIFNFLWLNMLCFFVRSNTVS